MLRLSHALRSAALLIAAGIMWAQTPSVSGGQSSVSIDRISFYSVPLACPAARNLGCGSAAKPVLLALEKRNTIQAAWLDHPGTTLAIVWKTGTTSESRAADLRSVSDEHNISLAELAGAERDKAWQSFHSGQQWYRGAEVDKLSEEEAMVITGRLIRRATAKAPTIAGKAEKLKTDIAQVIREQLSGCDSKECRANYRKKLEDTARKDLTEAEFIALTDAAKLGYRPVGNEQ